MKIHESDNRYNTNENDIPYALNAAFGANPKAYLSFSNLEQSEQAQIIDRARWAQSPLEIKSIIRELEGHG